MELNRTRIGIAAALLGWTTACASDTLGPESAAVALTFSNLPALDPAVDGTYEAWAIDTTGDIRSAGRFTLGAGAVEVVSPVAQPEHFMITVEPPGDEDDRPSIHKLLGGRFENGTASLQLTRYVTATVPLEPSPGTHVLASLTDNFDGVLDNEDAGIWVYDPTVDTLDAAHYQDFAPLTVGWSYEGWVVRDYGTPEAVWVSYGMFVPDAFRQANMRDGTGLGYYSGRSDFRFALSLVVKFPGDDFLSGAQGYQLPAPLSLPFDLNGDAAAGVPSRWTHVISIEPWAPNRDPELPEETRVFFLQPYVNAIGEAAPDVPREIGLDPAVIPSGTATITGG